MNPAIAIAIAARAEVDLTASADLRHRPTVGVEWTAELATFLLANSTRWQDHLREVSEGRICIRLLEMPDADAWLVLWAPGSSMVMHDHGRSATTFAVVEGELHERHHVDGDRRSAHRRLQRGDMVSVGRSHAQELSNPLTTTVASLHVFSPPLEEISRFDSRGVRTGAQGVGWVAGPGDIAEV